MSAAAACAMIAAAPTQLLVKISDPAPYGSATSYSGTLKSVTSDSTTATPQFGTAPYTYAWSKLGGDTIAATAPSSATTAFSGSVFTGDVLTASFRVAVTDSAGSPAAHANVIVTLENVDLR